jgi:hypothetical protein
MTWNEKTGRPEEVAWKRDPQQELALKKEQLREKQNQFWIESYDKAKNNYDATMDVDGYYLMAEVPLTNRLRAIGGARIETTDMLVTSQDATRRKGVLDLRDTLPQTKILLLAVFPRGATPDDVLRKKNTAVNETIAKLDDGERVFFLDIGPKFLAADGTLEKAIMPDLLHLSPRGYEIWAESIEPKLVELLGAK